MHRRRYKDCSEFNKDNYAYICTNKIRSLENKCVYSNSARSKVIKTCLEFSNELKADNEICINAPTSDPNTKYCALKTDESGCEEFVKENV